ncbi:hypothetical protein B5M09_013445, partial [Aphanomyces astaci]
IHVTTLCLEHDHALGLRDDKNDNETAGVTDGVASTNDALWSDFFDCEMEESVGSAESEHRVTHGSNSENEYDSDRSVESVKSDNTVMFDPSDSRRGAMRDAIRRNRTLTQEQAAQTVVEFVSQLPTLDEKQALVT